MNIYLQLFWTFFKISLFTFGGGAAMIPLVQQEVSKLNWLSDEMLINLVGIAESTPGPIAINVATYVGSTQAGILGSLVATIGIVLPPFLIILCIAKFFKNFLNNRFIDGALDGVKPVIVGLIFSVGIYFAFVAFFPTYLTTGSVDIDWRAFCLFIGLVIVNLIFKHYKKKSMSPILLIIISAVFGMIIYI